MPTTFFPEIADFKVLDEKVVYLTNGTFDNLLTFEQQGEDGVLAKAGVPKGDDRDPEYPLTENELRYLFESDNLRLDTPADVYAGASVLHGNKKYNALTVEFHFRNDATRHKWGSPVTYETDMPLPDVVLPKAEAVLERVKGKLAEFDGYATLIHTGYIDTDDRYALWVLVPFDFITTKFKTAHEYKVWLYDLFGGKLKD